MLGNVLLQGCTVPLSCPPHLRQKYALMAFSLGIRDCFQSFQLQLIPDINDDSSLRDYTGLMDEILYIYLDAFGLLFLSFFRCFFRCVVASL